MDADFVSENLVKFFEEMIKAKIVPGAAYVGGISRFVQILCSLVADVPALPSVFANGVLMPLINAKLIDLK